MKTVGEFKKAGLEFVDGDEGVSFCVCNPETMNADSMHDDSNVESFAWRENTGVKPEFNGFKELELKNGKIKLTSTFVAEDNEDWSIAGDGTDIIKWRPSLNQTSVAETDTKQSAIHKAWVALGGEIIGGLDDSVSVWHVTGGDYLNGEYFFSSGTSCSIAAAKFVCNTDELVVYFKEMSAEEKRIDIIGQNGNDGLHYDNTAQQVEVIVNNNTPFSIELASKGGFSYEFKATASSDKPIFTQAMADAGEKVKVGMEFSTARGNYVALLVNENTVVFEHEELGFVVEDHDFVHPIDNLTDREKAIDDAMLKIGCHPSQDFIAGAPFIIGKLFDAELLNTKVS